MDDVTRRVITEFEENFYTFLLSHYAERLKAYPKLSVIRDRYKNVKQIVNTKIIQTWKKD